MGNPEIPPPGFPIESLAREVAKHIKPRNVYGRRDFTDEEVSDLKTMLKVTKWLVGVFALSLLAIIWLGAEMVISYSDLQHLKSDTSTQLVLQKQAIDKVESSADSIRHSQDEIIPKIDQMTQAFNNANRRRVYDSKHPNDNDGND